MLSELSYKAPAMELGPIDVSNPPYERNPDYWNARDSVQIPVKQYFEWVNVDIWTCDLTISNSFPTGEGTNSITSCVKVFEVNVGRENKAPGYTYSGDIVTPPYKNGEIYQTTDSTFNAYPFEDGTIPSGWWMKQRANVISSNHQRAHFNAVAHWTDQYNPVGEGYIDFNEYFSLSFGLQIGVDITYYDPSTKTVWPGLGFESFSTSAQNNYDVNWQGMTLSADPYSTVSLTVDGVTIPAEVYWPNYSNSSGLSIAIDWTPGSTRDL